MEKVFLWSLTASYLFFTDGDGNPECAEKPEGRSCKICETARVKNGRSLVFINGGFRMSFYHSSYRFSGKPVFFNNPIFHNNRSVYYHKFYSF